MPEELVTIANFNDLAEAGLARNKLETSGVFCILQEIEDSDSEPERALPEELCLKVLISQAGAALEILNELEGEQDLADLEGYGSFDND
jgi:hypothetical protein